MSSSTELPPTPLTLVYSLRKHVLSRPSSFSRLTTLQQTTISSSTKDVIVHRPAMSKPIRHTQSVHSVATNPFATAPIQDLTRFPQLMHNPEHVLVQRHPYPISVRPKSKLTGKPSCVNCKHAHQSCDDQRPCGRCVHLGKEDTCIDAIHKKRGRKLAKQSV